MAGFLLFSMVGVINWGLAIRNILSQKAISAPYRQETGARAVATGYIRIWLSLVPFAFAGISLFPRKLPSELIHLGCTSYYLITLVLLSKRERIDELIVRKRKRKRKSKRKNEWM